MAKNDQNDQNCSKKGLLNPQISGHIRSQLNPGPREKSIPRVFRGWGTLSDDFENWFPWTYFGSGPGSMEPVSNTQMTQNLLPGRVLLKDGPVFHLSFPENIDSPYINMFFQNL